MLVAIKMAWNFLTTIPETIYGQVSDSTKISITNSVLFFIDLIPSDGVAMNDIATVILPVALILILLEIVGLVFAIVCLVFNIAYRNKKQVFP